MKHFNKITGVSIQLDFPEEWGDPTAIVDKAGGDSLHDVLWSEVDFHIRNVNSIWKTVNLAAIQDETNGFDVGSIRLNISHFESEDELNRTIEWCEERLHHAYYNLSDHKQRLAKVNCTKKSRRK
jgi:hypothetical protein